MINVLVPVVSALLFRAGGSNQWDWGEISTFGSHYQVAPNQKIWRWMMGIPIGLLMWHGWFTLALTTITYFIATNAFSYGDKTPILKYLLQNIKHFVSGVVFGLASFPLIGWWALLQALISGVVFYLIEVKKVNNPWAEFGRGFFGTLCV